MRRPALYSSASRARPEPPDADAAPSPPQPPEAVPMAQPAARKRWWSDPRLLWTTIVLLAAAALGAGTLALRPGTRTLTQKDIDAAVMRTLETNVLPSPAAKAYAAIIPSVV